MTYRTKIFLAALGAAAVALAVAALLVSWSLKRELELGLERTLVAHTGLAAAVLDGADATTDLDRVADELARLTGARVTVIAADGRVVGDSDFTIAELPSLENHAHRPEVMAATTRDVAVVRRYSTSVGYDALYSARRLSAADGRERGWVRLALPLTDISDQLTSGMHGLWPGFAAAIVVALAGAWGISRQLTRRLQSIAAAAERHASTGTAGLVPSQGTDEIARVARLVNASARALQTQLAVVAGERALLSAILSGMVEGVVVVDAKGQVQLANDAAHRMLGTGRTDAERARHYLEIVRHPEVTNHLARALAGETTTVTEFVLRRDPERICLARAAPVAVSDAGPAQAARGAVLVLHDITDLRRADRVRRDFVANVSHELRTPLTAIRGYIEALLDGGDESADRRRFLEIVERHTGRMQRLVSDLLHLARLDAGQERAAAEPVHLDSLVSTVASELAPAFARTHARLETRIAPGAATIQADPAKLHDVLKNLLENAANYSPEHGTVIVSAEARDAAAVLEIVDEGPGIPAPDLRRIFERFYRVDKARTVDPGGTGLGLAIVKHLVGLHGGTVVAANREPRGARFTVTLPQPPAPVG